MNEDDSAPMTFIFAPEIEEAVISILWHEPERCGQFYRELDPNVHLIQPALRIIAEAIDLTFRETLLSDFALVTHTVRELGQFDEVGGTEGLNRIFGIHQYRSNKENIGAIFIEYMRLLKAYALHRKEDPITMPYRFNRGSIQLQINKNKRSENSADYLGNGRILGRQFRAIAWKSLNDTISISLVPK